MGFINSEKACIQDEFIDNILPEGCDRRLFVIKTG